ncbi:hypothetical protein [Pyrococcus horikoshii]|uniref:Uncharacterized protein n=2 Tax=Pyrococcus horikoshii TaxID=53953 RepID=O59451_PYRHO|nr:hypothetical protein [Pyrococcus horikoshii]BAA30906.1 103aa long hypothetical protein [Pyrococcus horikoshii OT3]HII60752.1 hypothetical protein [Pyrococcus horikoshii]
MLRIATYSLLLNGILLLAYYYINSSYVYLAFSIFSFMLALGIKNEIRLAIKITLVYSGIEFFLALLLLMAGNITSSIDAIISLLILHDIIGYAQRKYGKEVNP